MISSIFGLHNSFAKTFRIIEFRSFAFDRYLFLHFFRVSLIFSIYHTPHTRGNILFPPPPRQHCRRTSRIVRDNSECNANCEEGGAEQQISNWKGHRHLEEENGGGEVCNIYAQPAKPTKCCRETHEGHGGCRRGGTDTWKLVLLMLLMLLLFIARNHEHFSRRVYVY